MRTVSQGGFGHLLDDFEAGLTMATAFLQINGHVFIGRHLYHLNKKHNLFFEIVKVRQYIIKLYRYAKIHFWSLFYPIIGSTNDILSTDCIFIEKNNLNLDHS
jgi:hypothetical protein